MRLGETDGWDVGRTEGSELGVGVGWLEGSLVGDPLGHIVGRADGTELGITVG